MIRLALALALLGAVACGGRPDSGAAAPWRTVFDSTGDTIVARTTGEVPDELVRSLELEQQIGEAEGSDSVTFGRIAYVDVTRDNHLFVFDEQGPSIKLFDSTGKLVRFVGRKGGGPGEFEQVTGMGTLPNGNLAIWDASHSRVNVYDVAGDFLQQWRVPMSGFFTYNGLFTDRDTSIVLTLPLTATGLFGESGYVRFSSMGAVRDSIRVPRWVDSTPQVLGQASNGQLRVSMALPFAPTNQHTWGSMGALVSGPSAPYVFYITQTSKRPVKILRDWTPVQTFAQERAEARDRVTWGVRMSLPEWKWPGSDIPSTKPAYQGLRTSDDGRIWVYLHSVAEKSEEIDAAPPAQSGMPPRPAQHYFEPNVVDVFEPSGVYLGRLGHSRSMNPLRMRGNHVWGVLTDSAGVAYVARWRIEPPFPAVSTVR